MGFAVRRMVAGHASALDLVIVVAHLDSAALRATIAAMDVRVDTAIARQQQ
jgi:hypothetical protein